MNRHPDSDLIYRWTRTSLGESLDSPESVSQTDAFPPGNGVEGEPESVPVIVQHGEHESLELLAEVYHRANGGAPTQGSYSSSNILKEFKSLTTKNTALHIAALCGNAEMADEAVQQEPDLIFSVNENNDTPLHVAARADQISIIRRLLDAYWVKSNNNVAKLLELMKMKNKQGNIVLHETVIGKIGAKIFDVLEAYTTTVPDHQSLSLSQSCYDLALNEVNDKGESMLYMAVEAKLMEVVNRILDNCPENATPKGISPLVSAIMERDKEMLTTIVGKMEDWIHLRGRNGEIALHVAARTGYHEGVVYLHERCKTCTIHRDNNGYLPLHLAARWGHVEVVQELLRYCSDLNEMLDTRGNNILHIAAKSGKFNVVKFILQTPQLEKMINQRNMKGDTPLHAATSHGQAKIVYALTWDNRVDLNVVNSSKSNETTPLDIAYRKYLDATETSNVGALRETLTWTALKSAGAKNGPLFHKDKMYDFSSTDRFKDRMQSMSVISTLIITASVTACFAVPGEADGTANNLHKAMFHLFIFCITVSLFSSIGATIILIWGSLGVIQLLKLAMDVAMPLLGTALVTLYLAFMAGIYTVISKLTWLATTFMIITSIFVAIIFVLFFLLFLPSSSTCKISRYISYYPFIFLASLAGNKPRESRSFAMVGARR